MKPFCNEILMEFQTACFISESWCLSETGVAPSINGQKEPKVGVVWLLAHEWHKLFPFNFQLRSSKERTTTCKILIVHNLPQNPTSKGLNHPF